MQIVTWSDRCLCAQAMRVGILLVPLLVVGHCPSSSQADELPYSWNIEPLRDRYLHGTTRLMFVGDSISKMADQRLPSGIVRRWRPPQGWTGGLVQLENNGLFGFGNLTSTPTNSQRQIYEFDDGISSRVGEMPLAPGTITEWFIEEDLESTGPLVRFQIRSGQWRGPDGPDWMARDDFHARLIYVGGPFGIAQSMLLTPYEVGHIARGESIVLGDAGTSQSIEWVEHTSGQSEAYDPPFSVVEFRVEHGQVVEPSGAGHILLGCRVFLDDVTGFEMGTMAAGGSSPSDWADASLYTDVQMSRLLEACDSNVVFVYLGANRGGDKQTYKTTMTRVAERIEMAFGMFEPTHSPIIVMISPHDMGGARDTQGWAEACFEITQERSQAQQDVAYCFLNLHDLILEHLGPWEAIRKTHMNDAVHPNQRGADDFMALVEAEILREPVERVWASELEVTVAHHHTGDLSTIHWSDDIRLNVQAAAQSCPSCPGIALEVTGYTSRHLAASIRMTLEGHTSIPMVNQDVLLWDFESSQWVPMATHASPVHGDGTIVVEINDDANRFVESGSGAIRARIGLVPAITWMAPVWFGAFDQICWDVTSQ